MIHLMNMNKLNTQFISIYKEKQEYFWENLFATLSSSVNILLKGKTKELELSITFLRTLYNHVKSA